MRGTPLFAGAVLLSGLSLTHGAAARVPTEVQVINFPVDSDGSLRVSQQQSQPNTSVLEFRVLQSELTANVGGNPAFTFPLPAGFTRASVMLQSLDLTKTAVDSYVVGFGPSAPPIMHFGPGDDRPFPIVCAIPTSLTGPSGCIGLYPSGVSDFSVSGGQMGIGIIARSPTGGPPSSDTEYYVHVFLAR